MPIYKDNRGWGYAIDYDKAIAADEAEIAAYSSEFAKVVAAECDRLASAHVAAGTVWLEELLERSAAVRAASGLTNDQIRAYLVRCYEGGGAYAREITSDDTVAAGLGPIVDWRADWIAGNELLKQPCPLHPGMKWGDNPYGFTEESRVKWLKRAKTHLSTHKRNKAKYGTK